MVVGDRLLTIVPFSLTIVRMTELARWRSFLLSRLRRGEISVTGAAWIAGVSKQAVSRWCSEAGIRVKESERAHWLQIRHQGLRLMRGVPRMTKAQRREEWLGGNGLEQEPAPPASGPSPPRRN